MEATKVTITRETMTKNKLTPKQKTRLLENKIIELIKSKPAGTPLSYADFGAVIDQSVGGAFSVITRMLRDGKIGRVENEIKSGHSRYSYYVITSKGKKLEIPEAPKTEQPVAALAVKGSAAQQHSVDEPKEESPKQATAEQPTVVRQMNEADVKAAIVESLAKEFYWETTSNSLHEFVEWCRDKRTE